MSQPDTLDFALLTRHGSSEAGSTRQARVPVAFVVNGASLLGLLAKGGADMMGCFVRGYGDLNQRAHESLLSAKPDDDCGGRTLLYTCPECGDIGCGAFAAKIDISGGKAVWSDFAYVNGYEPPSLLPEIGPFQFSLEDYSSAIESASHI